MSWLPALCPSVPIVLLGYGPHNKSGPCSETTSKRTAPCPFSLSRTESVAEKMLTNWFAFLLHKFLKVRVGMRWGAAVESKLGGCSSEPGHQD